MSYDDALVVLLHVQWKSASQLGGLGTQNVR
jgi:hypothetical protein